MPKGLPANYAYSPWVLQSKQPKPKFVHDLSGSQGADTETSNIIEHKYQVPKPQKHIVQTTEAAYANFITKSKEHTKSFNYTKEDQLKIRSNVILDLHDESSTIEKLDKLYDVRDGYAV
jgi:hypothetical protein